MKSSRKLLSILEEKIFREYDIRGIAGKDLTIEASLLIGKAFGTLLKEVKPDSKRVSVGRDVRLSSSDLASGIVGGINSMGLDIYDIGVCPTPLQYFSLYTLKLDGGIMVTGSHNPPEYNGFKLSMGDKTIYGDDIQRLKNIVSKKEWDGRDNKQGKVEKYDIAYAYKKYMLNEFSYLVNSKFKRFKVVVDAGNGTGGTVVPEILNGIGCDVIPLYCEPDGRFPNHHPDPTVIDNMRDLIDTVKKTNADIGVGYDGDADRIGVVDRDGSIIWGDQLMIILSRELLEREKGAKIIGDVKCSQVMFDDVKRHGGIPIMWKTGHSLIKQKMREEDAPIAGEFSGHIFIGDRYFGYDDAMYATFRLIEIMKNTGRDIKELLSDIPKLHCTPEIRIECPDDKKVEITKKVISRFIRYKENGNGKCKVRDINTVDGIRVQFDNGWGLIRTSNTQPAVVMRMEAVDEASLISYKAFLLNEFQEASKS